ncbi:MAG: amidohydrolase [Bacteroidota bacterium]
MKKNIAQFLEVCIVQTDLVWNDVSANLHHIEGLLGQQKEKPDLIVLPEMFNTAFVMNPSLTAEKPNGRTTQWLLHQAYTYQSVIAGSICVEENRCYYNRFIAAYPDGTLFTYDKRHLFRLADEHKHFSSGQHSSVFEVKGWKIKPLICYDLRFPVWSKNRFLNDEYEYDCLLYVANWPQRRNRVWKTLLPARAIENQAYVVGVNRIGMDGNSVPHAGESVVYDPKGNLMYAALPDTEMVECKSLNFESLSSFRKEFPIAYDWDTFTID